MEDWQLNAIREARAWGLDQEDPRRNPQFVIDKLMRAAAEKPSPYEDRAESGRYARLQRYRTLAAQLEKLSNSLKNEGKMKLDTMFPSKYLKASDLRGRDVEVTIGNVISEEVGDGHKPVVLFQGKDRGLVLNKTNAQTIGDAYGGDTDSWAGKKITLYAAKTQFNGQMVDCIRVRAKNSPPTEEFDDDIPF